MGEYKTAQIQGSVPGRSIYRTLTTARGAARNLPKHKSLDQPSLCPDLGRMTDATSSRIPATYVSPSPRLQVRVVCFNGIYPIEYLSCNDRTLWIHTVSNVLYKVWLHFCAQHSPLLFLHYNNKMSTLDTSSSARTQYEFCKYIVGKIHRMIVYICKKSLWGYISRNK